VLVVKGSGNGGGAGLLARPPLGGGLLSLAGGLRRRGRLWRGSRRCCRLGLGLLGRRYCFLAGDDGDLAGDDVVSLHLAAGGVVLAAAQLADDVDVRAFGEVSGRAGEFVPNSDAVPFGELLAGGAFAPEAAGS
jgi:hypothetical protein